MSCASLETKVRNTSGSVKFFSYIGSRGKRLEDGEEYVIQGDLLNNVANGSRAVKRRLAALNRALEDGDLVIVSSPKTHFYDETTDMTKVLAVANGSVTVTDPCWGEYSSSI